MRVLIACEFSGVVRDAFARRGHDAWSCDLLPSERPGQHLQCNVLDILADGWDLMIAHPPCDHLAVSGARWFAAKRADGRQQQGIDFFMQMVGAPIPRIAIENPVGIMSTLYRKPDQTIQPYNFGHDASKTTCLWLANLPPLINTNFSPPRMVCRVCGGTSPYRAAFDKGCAHCGAEAGLLRPRWSNQTDSGQNRLGPSADRWAKRSVTYPGIADAMAEQWG